MNEFIMPEDFPKNQTEFDARFADEQACYDYLFQCRFPHFYVCGHCGHKDNWKGAQGLLICTRCERQHYLTAGTIFHGTRKPLTAWFKAMWWFTTRKSGVNAVNLKDLLGLGSYGTAWSWLQKLRSCTVRKEREKLSGNMEADEFYLGGQHRGERGRGASHKYAVAIAVERKDKKLWRLRVQATEDCSADELMPFVQDNVEPASAIATDGWEGFNDLKKEGYDNHQIFQNKVADKQSVLPGGHLVISLIKHLVLGTFQDRFEKKYFQAYLDEYTFRFNRRNCKHVCKKLFRIAQQAVVTSSRS